MVQLNGFSGCDRMGLMNGFSRSWVFWVKRSRFLGSSESESVFGFVGVGVGFWVHDFSSFSSFSLSACLSSFFLSLSLSFARDSKMV